MARESYGMDFGANFKEMLDQAKNKFADTANPQAREEARGILSYISANVHKALENVVRISNADQFKTDVAREVQRAEMSFKYLTALKNANGV